MRKNLTKAKLAAGEVVLGCFVRYPDAALAEFLALQGWDFLVLDAEHGTLEPRDCEHMVRAAEVHEVSPFVRATTNQPPTILRFLDGGAQGIHVPWVNTAEQARDAVRSVKYHPEGIRGLAGSRAADYAQRLSFADYIKFANAQTLVVVQVETADAAANIAGIVATPGVDVVFIGPTDLSHSLGVPGDTGHAKVKAAIECITQAVLSSGKVLGIMVGDPEGAKAWRARGARYITVTLEAVLGKASKAYLQAARGGGS